MLCHFAHVAGQNKEAQCSSTSVAALLGTFFRRVVQGLAVDPKTILLLKGLGWFGRFGAIPCPSYNKRSGVNVVK